MIDPNLKLTVLHDDDSVFNNYTNEAVDYLNNPIAITLTTADFIYVGYSKPFNATYVEMQTANVNPANLSVEYYDGTSWVTAEFHDDTRALSESGLISWDKSSMEAASVNSIEKYYVRVSVDADTSAMVIDGLNILFSEDKDLKADFPSISDSSILPVGYTSHLPHHVAARNEIVQHLRNRGNQKTNSAGAEKDINAFDLHDIFQIKQAAAYLVLAKVFFNLSDNPEDHWFMKFQEYTKKYNETMQLYNLNIDTDDDGIEDLNENDNKYKVFRFSR